MRVICECGNVKAHSTLYPHYALWICPVCNRIPKPQVYSHIRLCEGCLASFSSPDKSAKLCKECDPTLDTWSRQIKLYLRRMNKNND